MSARKAVWITALSSGGVTAMGVLSSMALARLLTPAEVGTYSVAAVCAGLAHHFRDMGTTTYIIQATELDRRTLGRAFAVTLLMSSLLCLLALLAAAPLGRFYRAPELEQVLQLLALNFLVVPFGANSLALLRRGLRFKERALIDQASAITGIVVGVGTAWWGFGARSLALATLASTLVTTLLATWWRPREHQWSLCFERLGELLGYGAQVALSTLMAQLNRGVVELIGGRMLGMSAVGLFNKAKSLPDQVGAVVNGVASQVTLPLFAQWHREGRDLSPIYLQTVALVTGMVWPFCAVAALYPHEVLHVMFGPQWLAAAGMLRALSLLTLLASPFWFWTYLLFSLGETRKVLRGEVVNFISQALVLLALLHAGVQNLALAVLLATPLGLAHLYWLVRGRLGFSHGQFLAALGPSAGVMLATGLAAALPLVWTEGGDWRLAVAVALALPAWMVAVLRLEHRLAPELRALLARLGWRGRRGGPGGPGGSMGSGSAP